jgi:PAS domain S-box-containing protein
VVYQSTILIVDDDEDARDVLRRMLSKEGYNLALAVDGTEALAKVAELIPDLILLDVMMPDIDGFEVCQRLRVDPLLGEVPIIMVTALHDRQSRLKGIEAGADDFITKPFDRNELQTRIRTITRLNRYRQLYQERVQRQQAEEELRRTAERLKVLHEIDQAILEARSPQAVAMAALRNIQRLGPYHYAAVAMFEAGSDEVTMLATSADGEGWLDPELQFPLNTFTVTEALRQGKERVVEDITLLPEPAPADEALLAQGIRAYITFPLIAQGELVGTLSLAAETLDSFGPEHRLAARELTTPLAVAIQQARLNEQVKQQANELQQQVVELQRAQAAEREQRTVAETLRDVASVLSASLKREQVLRSILEQLARVIDYDNASVMLLSGDALQTVAYRGPHSESSHLDPLPAEIFPSIHQVLETHQPLIIPDTTTDSRWVHLPDRKSTRCWLGVPLMIQDRSIGLLNLSKGQPSCYSKRDAELATAFANHAVVAIENARLYEQAQVEIADRRQAEEGIRWLYQELQHHTDSLEEAVSRRTLELKTERDRTQAILETLGEAVIVADRDGTIQYINPAAAILSGFTREGALGENYYSWQGETLLEARSQIEQVIGEGQTWRGEITGRRQDGTQYDTAVTIAPLFGIDHPNQVIGFVSVQRDITPIKEAERLKDQFISNVSHELRTPLSVITLISGNLDTLYGRLEDDRRLKMIRDIRSQAQVLDDLIGDVLEISRIESGRISEERQLVNLSEIVREEASKQQPLAHKRSHVLQTTCTESLLVWGNGGQLRQVIRNLLSNAIKFTPDGGQITLECLPLQDSIRSEDWPGTSGLGRGRWAALRVVDNGIGISTEDLPHLFERFYRAEAESNVPGTGLGLAISRELVELHGGHIAAASTQGTGSTFAVYLPLSEEN